MPAMKRLTGAGRKERPLSARQAELLRAAAACDASGFRITAAVLRAYSGHSLAVTVETISGLRRKGHLGMIGGCLAVTQKGMEALRCLE